MTGRASPLPGLLGLGSSALPGLLSPIPSTSGGAIVAPGAPSQVRWDPNNKSSNLTLSNGDRTAANVTDSNGASAFGTVGKTAGKWYVELTVDNRGNPSNFLQVALFGGGTARGDTANTNKGVGLYINGSSQIQFQSQGTGPAVSTAYNIGPILANTNIVGMMLDATAGAAWYSWNGAWLFGDPAAGTSPIATGLRGGPYFPAIISYLNPPTGQLTINATTTYAAPAGAAIW